MLTLLLTVVKESDRLDQKEQMMAKMSNLELILVIIVTDPVGINNLFHVATQVNSHKSRYQLGL